MYFLGGVSKKVIPYIYVPSFIKGAVCVQHCIYMGCGYSSTSRVPDWYLKISAFYFEHPPINQS